MDACRGVSSMDDRFSGHLTLLLASCAPVISSTIDSDGFSVRGSENIVRKSGIFGTDRWSVLQSIVSDKPHMKVDSTLSS